MVSMRFLFLLASVSAVIQLDFAIHRGDSRNDRGLDRRTVVKRDGVDLTVENKKTYYMAQLELGSNKQKVGVLVDTGSSDLWVPADICYDSGLPYYGYEKGGVKFPIAGHDKRPDFLVPQHEKRADGDDLYASSSDPYASPVTTESPSDAGYYFTADGEIYHSAAGSESWVGRLTVFADDDGSLFYSADGSVSYIYYATSSSYYSTPHFTLAPDPDADSDDEYATGSLDSDEYYSTYDDDEWYYYTTSDDSGSSHSTRGYDETLYQRSSQTSSYTYSYDDSDDDDDEYGDYYTSATYASGTSATTTYDLYACTSHGTFNTDSSDSYEENEDLPSFQVLYADTSYAIGQYGSDDVTISNITLKNLTFAVCGKTDSDSGVLGIGLQGLEASNSLSNTRRSVYENFPMHLKSQGLIKKTLYSVALGKNNASEGSILFGAVDHSKYTGTLQRVQIINRYKGVGYKEAPYLDIALDSITGRNLAVTYRTPVGLDTGSTINYLPAAYVSRIGKSLRGDYNSSGYWTVACEHKKSKESLTFDFSGVKIEVPVKDLVLEGLDGYCYLGIFESEVTPILGDSFLRNAYVVYDLDAFEIALAPSSDGTDEPNIEEVASEIPSASEAPRYSFTAVSQVFTTTSRYGFVVATLTTSSFKNSISQATPDTTDASWSIESDPAFTYTGTMTVNGTWGLTTHEYTVGGSRGNVDTSTSSLNETPNSRPHGLMYLMVGVLGFLALF